jgi:hypothetical protein
MSVNNDGDIIERDTADLFSFPADYEKSAIGRKMRRPSHRVAQKTGLA